MGILGVMEKDVCRFIVRMGYNQLHFFLTVQDTLKFVDEEKEKMLCQKTRLVKMDWKKRKIYIERAWVRKRRNTTRGLLNIEPWKNEMRWK